MQIKNMFQKDIERELYGVIIAGENADEHISQELGEYVVTRELHRHFADFFAAYKKGIEGETPKMGVWISGFFGSGKSHFLKILSYLLQNKEVGDRHAIDFFEKDGKITDPALLADMRLAAETPADVILFNIDSKSTQKDSILQVFLRVFNEMRGYSGAMPYVADLEQRLEEKGLLSAFQEKFEESYGDPWKESLHNFDFISDTVVEVLVELGFMGQSAAENWVSHATDPYEISIEDFAKRVRRYIEKNGGRHVVFMADEMGQYISDDPRLMLNLQTVTEELGKECRGKAWVVVTSQQAIDAITDNVKSNDFSKIQGRFDTRLSLTSANVDEVIKRRILEKTDTAAQSLRMLYDQKETTIKNLLIWADASEKKLYENAEDFAEVYPFIPYQFRLLAETLGQIRQHGASGKHLSEGERSMLGIFKDAAVQLKDHETGALLPFYRFYDGLENFLDHNHAGVIQKAYDNKNISPAGKTEDVFPVDVLKTLFLIKYNRFVESKLDNIITLMVSQIDDDRITLREQVQDALAVLENQKLIQKNSDGSFEFLTDEEQEINNMIDKMEVSSNEILQRAMRLVFEDVLGGENKFQRPKFGGRYVFTYGRKLDDRTYGANLNYTIGLQILTPWADNREELRMLSAQKQEAFLRLPDSDAFLEEIRLALKIDKYFKGEGQALKYRNPGIYNVKTYEEKTRLGAATTYLKQALEEADIYVNGDLFRVDARDAAARINSAMERLVETVYHKLDYIDKIMTVKDIEALFQSTNQSSMDLSDAADANPHALDDVYRFVSLNTAHHVKTSMKTLLDHFTTAPYGFVPEDVWYLAACLFRRGDLSFFVRSQQVTRSNRTPREIVDYITKKQYVDALLMEVHEHVPASQKKAVQDAMHELFGQTISTQDEDSLMMEFQNKCKEQLQQMEIYEGEYAQYKYPGRAVIEQGKKLLNPLAYMQSPKDFFKKVFEQQDDLFDFAEEYERVRDFFRGEQKGIFTVVLGQLRVYENSRVYIENEELTDVVQKMRAIVENPAPYGEIYKLPELRDKFTSLHGAILEQQREPVLQAIERNREQVFEALEQKPYKEKLRARLERDWQDLAYKAQQAKDILKVRSYIDASHATKDRHFRAMESEDARILREMERVHSADSSTVVIPVKPKTRWISVQDLAGRSVWEIKDAAELERFLNVLRANLQKEMDDGTILKIEL